MNIAANVAPTGPAEQALLLQLYDPSRARDIRHRGKVVSRAGLRDALEETGRRLAASGGRGLYFLLEPDGSPLVASLLERLKQKLPEASVHYYTPLARDSAYRGAEMAFGRPLETHLDLEKADVIVSLDNDFLGRFPEATRLTRQFAARRDPSLGELNRLYAVECTLSVTGMTADHRVRLRSSEMLGFAVALLVEVARTGDASAQALANRLAPLAGRLYTPPASEKEKQQKVLAAMARDLRRAAGKALVLVGPRQPAGVHAAAHAINQLLGATAPLVRYAAPIAASSGPQVLQPLLADMAAGKVDTLIINAWNPAYSTPGDVRFGNQLSRVPNSFYLSLYQDETAELASWHIPAAHTFESWGDLRTVDGTVSLTQPLIEPLFGGFTSAELLATLLGERRTPIEGLRAAGAPKPTGAEFGPSPDDDMQRLKEFWRAQRRQQPGQGALSDIDFESFWQRALQRGLIDNTAFAEESASVDLGKVAAALEGLGQEAGGAHSEGLELNVLLDTKILDGRFANNAWLQELPDPVSKQTWGNAVLLSPATAKRLGINQEDQRDNAPKDVVEVAAGGAKLRAPAIIIPGHADDAVSIAVGYGRRGAEVNARDVGANVYPLTTAASPWFRSGVTITRTGERVALSITQEHWTMEKRPLALDLTVEELKEGEHSETFEKIAVQRQPLPSMYKAFEYNGQRWAMSIDLSRCTGCNACVVACQSENNIPAVGAEGVRRSREMHWLRIDRYFIGDDEEPQVITQPVACVHCENAPCEYVCPVNATVHSDEGLNEMVYNRCVGTRFCSNNCPYKVRRFNYLNYTGRKTELEQLMANPDVTVRGRGVMEKCSYCVQRIERARIESRVSGQPLADGDVRTACQQVCPGEAIVFGDLNLKDSAVSRRHNDERHYFLLHELGTRPRTTYLARVRNPNPELAHHG